MRVENKLACDIIMAMPLSAALYKGHRFSTEIISHAVWLYHCSPFSYREVEEMVAQRGITVSLWNLKAM